MGMIASLRLIRGSRNTTNHLASRRFHAGASFKMSENRLKDAKSPYLLQHKDNPVHWQEWSTTAFETAKKENKPILLSVGYAACHWCHVMAHESFEDDEVAKIMNESFVNVKVDREERPDVDRVYMTYLQATSCRGGWPATYFLTPELTPIFAGTYLPKHTFISLMTRVSSLWAFEDKQSKIREQGEDIMRQLKEISQERGASTKDHDPNEALAGIFRHFKGDYDAEHGGFGDEPKFPSPALTFHPLLRLAAYYKDTDALDMVKHTLQCIQRGGIHDHVGEGIARYSVDEKWLLPHFEKMLYDQAQLLTSSLEAALLTPEPKERLQLEKMAAGIIWYLKHDLQNKDGHGFYCAEDADSLPGNEDTVKKEGAFYVWTHDQLSQILGGDCELFSAHFGVESGGNVPSKHDIQGELAGQNVLAEQASIEETAQCFDKSPEEAQAIIVKCLDNMKAYRDKHRPRPHLDDKILTAWNGLTISALCKAADHPFLPASSSPALAARPKQLDGINGKSLQMAKAAVDFIRSNLWDPKTRTLSRSYREGKGPQGQADDYAFFIAGLLDLFESDNCRNEDYLKLAAELQERMDQLFYDETGGGYFASPAGDPYVLTRLKEMQEGAEPTATAVALSNLHRLARYFDDRREDYHEKKGRAIVKNAGSLMERAPFAMGTLVSNSLMDAEENDMKEIVVTGSENDPKTKELLQAVRSVFVPNRILHVLSPEHPTEYLASRCEAVRAVIEAGRLGESQVQICENKVCGLPVKDVEEVRKLLSA